MLQIRTSSDKNNANKHQTNPKYETYLYFYLNTFALIYLICIKPNIFIDKIHAKKLNINKIKFKHDIINFPNQNNIFIFFIYRI